MLSNQLLDRKAPQAENAKRDNERWQYDIEFRTENLTTGFPGLYRFSWTVSTPVPKHRSDVRDVGTCMASNGGTKGIERSYMGIQLGFLLDYRAPMEGAYG